LANYQQQHKPSDRRECTRQLEKVSKEAGPRVAAIISVVETCRRLKIPVRDYLGSVLPGLGDFPISRIAELTSAAWATRN